MTDQQWARPFRIIHTDGRIRHGVQFPSGVCVVALDDSYLLHQTWPRFEDMVIDPDAVVEWADGGGADGA